MLTLQNKNETPPGGFRYRVDGLPPEFQWVGPTHSFNDLRNDIRKRCSANGVSVPSDSEIEDQICRSLGPGRCNDENGVPWSGGVNNGLNLATIRQGTVTLLDWFMNGRERVSLDEASRRSSICIKCQFNQPIGDCTACAMKGLRDLVNQIVANQTLPTDTHLGACAICQCSLVAKTRMGLDTIRRHTSQDQLNLLPEHCWIRG